MKKFSTLVLPTAVWSVLACACVTDADDLYEADAIAAQDADQNTEDGKADAASAKARLDRSTPAEVTATFAASFSRDLDACVAAYRSRIDQNMSSITATVANKFTSLANAGCRDGFDVAEVSKALLNTLGQSSASSAEMKVSVNAWALPLLRASTINGFVSVEKATLTFYDAVITTQTANAMAREQDPAGMQLRAIRAAWDEVTENSNFDNAYLNPVQLTQAQVTGSSATLFRTLRKHFPLRAAALVESGTSAPRTFHLASEGPANSPTFAPIETALAKTSIKKRFYFAGGGRSWSTNVLIVIDQHNQAWGFQMGYTE